MKRLRKRMLSILLVLAMAFSLMPVTAFAAAEPPDEGSLSEWVKETIQGLEGNGYKKHGPFQIKGSDLYQYTFDKSDYDDEGALEQDSVYIILPGKSAKNTKIPDYRSIRTANHGQTQNPPRFTSPTVLLASAHMRLIL